MRESDMGDIATEEAGRTEPVMPRPYREPGDAPNSEDVFVAVAPTPDTPAWLQEVLVKVRGSNGNADSSPNGDSGSH